MDELEKKRVRNLLLISDAEVKAAKLIIRLPMQDITEKLACHCRHVMQNMAEIVGVMALDKVITPSERFEHARPILLDGEEDVNGRVVYTPNGTEPSKEVDEKDNVSA